MVVILALTKIAGLASAMRKERPKMKCYAGTGDRGETCVFGGRLDKHDDRVDAIGSIDELNAFLGAAKAFSSSGDVKRVLGVLGNDVFSIGAELAGASSADGLKVGVKSESVKRLELLIDDVSQKLPVQEKFIIPSGTKAAMMLNLSRVVCRRAERALVKLDRNEKLNPDLLKYSNRMSSLLHVLMRLENLEGGVEEKHPVYSFIK